MPKFLFHSKILLQPNLQPSSVIVSPKKIKNNLTVTQLSKSLPQSQFSFIHHYPGIAIMNIQYTILNPNVHTYTNYLPKYLTFIKKNIKKKLSTKNRFKKRHLFKSPPIQKKKEKIYSN
jgi:hypothetical protein